jgi:hypothetical protein
MFDGRFDGGLGPLGHRRMLATGESSFATGAGGPFVGTGRVRAERWVHITPGEGPGKQPRKSQPQALAVSVTRRPGAGVWVTGMELVTMRGWVIEFVYRPEASWSHRLG